MDYCLSNQILVINSFMTTDNLFIILFENEPQQIYIA
jgi:hypothetical protein